MKFTTNIKIDIALIVVFTALIVSGIGIHLSDEHARHELWHSFAVAHVVCGILFLVLGILHIKGHWAWFKALSKRFKKMSKPTMILTLLFLFETVSGIILLGFTHGGNSHIGLWHWWCGLLMTAFGIGHLLKRLKPLKRGYALLKGK